MKKVTIKRIYEEAAKSDGYRVLVDRLWPRGVLKGSAKIDLWMKDVTPSAKLRSWFHKDAESRFSEFSKQYAKELVGSKNIIELRNIIKKQPTTTLVTAVKDIEHSHIPTLIKKLGILIDGSKIVKASKKNTLVKVSIKNILEKTEKICSRGHAFYKSSDVPTCPICWPGRYKNK